MWLLSRLFQAVYNAFTAPIEWKREAKAQNRFSPEVCYILRAGGWHPGRSMDVPESIRWHAQASSIVAEFGGLRFGDSWNDRDGVDTTCASVSVFPEPVSDGDERLSGVCEFGDAWIVVGLFIDLDGYVYINGPPQGDKSRLEPVAETFDKALENLLRGRKARADEVAGAKTLYIKS